MEESISKEQIADLRGDIKTELEPFGYSPLSLAYLGDSVMDLLVKSYFVTNSNKQTYKYHKEVTDIVNAKNQAMYADLIYDTLDEDEQDVFRRGRNVKTHSKAKNATMGEYRKATGLEALYGYLYLKGNFEKLHALTDDMIVRHLQQTVTDK
ncbi:MAG: ribonuclease III domain-containing protein [Eubacteriales bacterium]|nr:ribonuclease III domain-containing protein [Eubacteriales bacterium]